MTTILFRTVLIYVSLITTMRLMGKRQIGELEVTDLVTTLLLSEIASLPITDRTIPVVYAIIPMITLLTLEVLSSYILLRVPRLKSLLSARPTVLINRGKLDQRAMREVRVSLDELMSEIRQQGLTSLAQVNCAILEKDGKLTVIPHAAYAQPTVGQLGIDAEDEPLMHIVFTGGTFSDTGLSLIGKDRAWLSRELARRGLERSRLYCVTANEAGEIYYITKETRK
ncbi:MAG: DUF421 domain-containing protein [Clostridia bacterium]|nr:DUF421 domain-containing protein [Clostridia bacterium]